MGAILWPHPVCRKRNEWSISFSYQIMYGNIVLLMPNINSYVKELHDHWDSHFEGRTNPLAYDAFIRTDGWMSPSAHPHARDLSQLLFTLANTGSDNDYFYYK